MATTEQKEDNEIITDTKEILELYEKPSWREAFQSTAVFIIANIIVWKIFGPPW